MADEKKPGQGSSNKSQEIKKGHDSFKINEQRSYSDKASGNAANKSSSDPKKPDVTNWTGPKRKS